MRTVEKIKQEYSKFGYLGHNPQYINWKFAQELENNKLIVQECFSSGIIRLKLPDWYKLKLNKNDLLEYFWLNDIVYSYLRITKTAIYIKA